MEPGWSSHAGQQAEEDMPREHQMPVHLPSSLKDIRQIMAFNSIQDRVAASLEPLIRKVVREEVQRSLALRQQNLVSQSQMQISPEIPLYQLIFKHPPKTPIFACSKIRDHDGNPLQILLVDSAGSPCLPPSPIKIELVPLDGDFPSQDDWTSDEFERAIVKARASKRPLLTGDVSDIPMRGGVAIVKDLQFTDNSSWIRSRHFRVGLRAVPGSYEHCTIKENMTKRFTVKDHRGELNRKKYPPMLTDEVWRLEKIGKNGAFHNKLSDNRINNIQELLKLWVVDHGRLRQILAGMPETTWEKVITHALTCDLGKNIFYYCNKNFTVFINSICQVVRIIIDGVPYTPMELSKDHIQYLIREAYQQWDNLKEADEFDANVVALIQSHNLAQGGVGPVKWYPNSSQDSGIIDLKGDTDEGSSSVSFQFDQVSSMEWNHDFNQIPRC